MSVILMTGFPGFLGSALAPPPAGPACRRRAVLPGAGPSTSPPLATGSREIEAEHPHARGRIDLVDRRHHRRPASASTRRPDDDLDDVDEVWHLAAVYDLAVPPEVARRVNVDGTARVLDLCRALPAPAAAPPRQHLLRQRSLRRRVRRGRPRPRASRSATTTSRPSTRPSCWSARRWPTGCPRRSTARASWSATPRPGRPRSTTARTSSPRSCGVSRPSRSCRRSATRTWSGSAWCRATSSSTRWTCCRCWTRRVGRTYALTDPEPADRPRGRRHLRPAPGQAGGLGAAAARPDPRGRRPAARAWSGLLGLPAEALDYFASPTTYSTTQHDDATWRAPGVTLPALRRVRRPAARLHDRPPRDRLEGDGLSAADAPTTSPSSSTSA